MSFDKSVLFSMFRPKVVEITVEHEGNSLDCFVRELSAEQVFRLQEMQKRNEKEKNADSNEQFTINMLAQALCDEEGKPIFKPEDAKKLKEMQVSAFNKLAQAVANSIGLSTPKKEGEEGVSNGSGTSLETTETVGNA